MNIYTCSICYAVNAAVRLHCASCGTIPAAYNVTNKPARLNDDFDYTEVVSAYGCERQTDRRAHKTYMRTVPADYYATE